MVFVGEIDSLEGKHIKKGGFHGIYLLGMNVGLKIVNVPKRMDPGNATFFPDLKIF